MRRCPNVKEKNKKQPTSTRHHIGPPVPSIQRGRVSVRASERASERQSERDSRLPHTPSTSYHAVTCEEIGSLRSTLQNHLSERIFLYS
jgi:hypothetical protein